MKISTIIVVVFSFLFLAGCAHYDRNGHRVSYSIAPAESWLNPNLQKPTYRQKKQWVNPDNAGSEISIDDISEKVDCLLPGDKQPTIVYSKKLCKQLQEERKIQLNKKAVEKVFGVEEKKQQQLREPSLMEILKEAEKRNKICRKLKRRDLRSWCSFCPNTSKDDFYCRKNGYPARRNRKNSSSFHHHRGHHSDYKTTRHQYLW